MRKEALIALGKIAGVRIFAILPENEVQPVSTDVNMTEDGHKELKRIVDHFMKHRKLPDVPKFNEQDQNEALLSSGETVRIPSPDAAQLQGDWKVRSFSAPGGKGLWIMVRTPKHVQLPEPQAKAGGGDEEEVPAPDARKAEE